MKVTVILVNTLCLCLSLMIIPCVSSATHVQEHRLHEQEATNEVKVSFPTMLPRKLRLLEEVTNVNGNGGENSVAYKKQKGGDRKHQKVQKVRNGNTGTWEEWMEGEGEGSPSDKSQFFTMDYSHVRRRRPIHNKSIPVGP